MHFGRVILAFAVIALLVSSACAQKKADIKLALAKSAKQMKWPAHVYSPKDNEFAGESYGISIVGQEAEEVESAYIAAIGEARAKESIDRLKDNGLKGGTFHNHPAVIMKKGERICEAGGTVGFGLSFARSTAGFIAGQLGTDIDESQICAESPGLVAWRCGGLLFVAVSPRRDVSADDEPDPSREIAETLYSHATDPNATVLCMPQAGCTGHMQCPRGSRCESGECVPMGYGECIVDADCPVTTPMGQDMACIDGKCVEMTENCTNNADDDGDKLVDCFDTDSCGEHPFCNLAISGKVVDGAGRPLKNIEVTLDAVAGTKRLGKWSNHTGPDGGYAIHYPDGKEKLLGALEPFGRLSMTLKDGNNRFVVLYDKGRAGIPFYVESKKFPLPDTGELDIVLKKGDPSIERYSGKSDDGDRVWGAAKVYYDQERIFNFTIGKLKYDFKGAGNALPLSVYIYSPEAVDTSRDSNNNVVESHYAFYDPAKRGGGVFFSPEDSAHDFPQAPENGVWHEFFHFTMYNKYAGWGKVGTDYGNHAGFKNTYTGDSLEEGFAEFWPVIASIVLDGAKDDVYANIFSMEPNYKSWDRQGKYEEVAFATLLFDLYDKGGDAGDNVTVPYREIWDVLMGTRHQDVQSAYKGFKAKWPNKPIDDVFIAHGFFVDNETGNGKYDNGEPYWDSDRDGVWERGEKWIDLGIPNNGTVGMVAPKQIYTKGNDTVGTSSNYLRTGRKNKPLDPKCFVKITVPAGADPVYRVSYKFRDPSLDYETVGLVDERTGYVYVEMAPPEYEPYAEVTVDNYEFSDRLSVSYDDYERGLEDPRPFMAEKSLAVAEKKESYCNLNGVCESQEGPSCADCSTDAAGDDACCMPALTAIFSLAFAAIGRWA